MSLLRRVLAGVAVLVGASSMSWLPMSVGLASASAEPSGALGFSPATGIDWTPLSVVSTGTCSDPRGANLQLTVTGHGFPGPTNVTPNLSASIYPVDPSTGGYDVPLQDSLHNFAAQQSPPAVLSGRYDFTLVCKKPLGFGTFGTYVGSLVFTSPAHYRALTEAPTVKTTVSPRPQVTRSAAAPKPAAPKPPAPASVSGHSTPPTRVAPVPTSPTGSRRPTSVTKGTPTATSPADATPTSSPAVAVPTPSLTSRAPAYTALTQSSTPEPQLATDPPDSRRWSGAAQSAAVAATSLVVAALGLVVRRRLHHRRPT